MKRECCDAFLAGQVTVGSLAPGTEHFSKRLIFAFETQQRAGLLVVLAVASYADTKVQRKDQALVGVK